MRAGALGRPAAVRPQVAVTIPPVAVPLTQRMACNAASFFRRSVPSLPRRRALNRRFALAASSGDIRTAKSLAVRGGESAAAAEAIPLPF